MQGLDKILKNTGWMAVEQVMRIVAGLFIGIWIARHLGPVEYGALNFALALVALVGVFATLGLSRTVVRELTLHETDGDFPRRIVATTLTLRVMFSMVCYLLAVAVSVLFEQGRSLLVGIVAGTMAFSSFDVIDLYFQSRMASRYSVIARSINFAFFLCVKIALLLTGADVVFFAVATTLEALGSALALWVACRSYGIKLQRKDVDLHYGFRLVAQSWPELFAGFACIVFMRMDQLMLGSILGEGAVGQYSVASRLAESWYFIPSALVASTFPSIVRQRTLDRTLYLKRIHQLMVSLVALSYVVALIVTFAADWVVHALFGEAYSGSAAVLVILVWGGIFVCLGTASGSWIMAESRPILNLWRNVSGALANIAFNYFLIPGYGTVGAAIGTLLALSIAYLFTDFLSLQTRHIGVLKLKALFLIYK